MKRNLVSVKDLQMTRSASFTLDIPSLDVPAGRILCVAGPNGSGKSTFLACLVGLLQASCGRVDLNGVSVGADLRSTKAILGYIPDDEDWFVKELTAREYFALVAKVYADAGVTSDTLGRAQELADALYFSAFDQQLGSLSHGNKKKVQIIAGLMHQPKVIVVDELRNGLDPLAIIAAEAIVKAEASRGAAVVAATHDLWWAQRMADGVLLLVDGKVAVRMATGRIVQEHGGVEQLFMKVAVPNASAL